MIRAKMLLTYRFVSPDGKRISTTTVKNATPTIVRTQPDKSILPPLFQQAFEVKISNITVRNTMNATAMTAATRRFRFFDVSFRKRV